MRRGPGHGDRSRGRSSALYWLLVVSGLGLAGTGVFPAEMRDGSPFLPSPFTIVHVLMEFLVGVTWAVAAFLLIGAVERNPRWRHLRPVTVTLAVLCVAGLAFNIFGRALPALSQRPGLVQRIAFAIYFIWFVVMALQLLSVKHRHTITSSSPAPR